MPLPQAALSYFLSVAPTLPGGLRLRDKHLTRGAFYKVAYLGRRAAVPQGATGVRLRGRWSRGVRKGGKGGGADRERKRGSGEDITKKKKNKRLDPHTVPAAGQTTTQWARDSIKTNFGPQSKQWKYYSCIFSHVNRDLKRVMPPLNVFLSF